MRHVLQVLARDFGEGALAALNWSVARYISTCELTGPRRPCPPILIRRQIFYGKVPILNHPASSSTSATTFCPLGRWTESNESQGKQSNARKEKDWTQVLLFPSQSSGMSPRGGGGWGAHLQRLSTAWWRRTRETTKNWSCLRCHTLRTDDATFNVRTYLRWILPSMDCFTSTGVQMMAVAKRMPSDIWKKDN